MEAAVAQRRRGPVPRLSVPLIAAAVVEVGFDQSSLTAVAAHLGVTHGALYRHVRDRDEMMRSAMVLAVERFSWPDMVEDWQQVVWNEARAWWSFCEAHPGFVEVLANTPGTPASIARRSLAVAVHLRGRGVAGEDALIAVDFLSGTVHNIFLKQAQRAAVLDRVESMPAEEMAEIVGSIPPDMLEVIAAGLVDDPWPWFSRKLQLVLDGIESHGVGPFAP